MPMNSRLLRPLASGAAFNPASIAGLAAWYDSAVSSSLFDATTGGSVVAADAGVARWEDQSGNGNHLTQSIANNRPLRKVATFSGRDSLQFDGNNDSMQLTNAIPMISGASIVVVSRKDDSLNQGGMYSLTGFISSNHHPFASSGSAYDGFGSTTRFQFSQAYRSDLYVWSVVAGSQYTAYADNSVLHQVAYTPANQTASYPDQLVGAGRGDGAANFAGRICEVIIYTRGISVAENTLLYGYLKAKWGTA